MPILAVQYTLVENVAQNLLASLNNIKGAASDPIPLIVKNEDASNTIWIGGPGVSTTAGQSLLPGAAIPMALYNSDAPYAFCSTGTPVVSVLAGRQ